MRRFLLLVLMLAFATPVAAALRVGDAAPRVTVSDLNGKPFVVPDNLLGKVAIIHFWTAGCSSCREEMPAMDGLYREYQRKGLVIIAVNIGQSRKTVQKAVAGLGISYPVLLDGERRMAGGYDVAGVPRTLIIDRSGTVRFKIIGTASRETLKKCLQTLLF